MAQIFKAKTLVSSTGRFSHEATAPNLVYNTGDQIISGNKFFVDNINVSGSGIFNALDLNNIDTLTISGVDISIINGEVNLTNRPTVNGTGVLLSGEAASLPTTIVYTTGDQTVSGLKDFTTRPTVNTTPVLLSGEYAAGLNLLVKNDESFTVYKGQPVYINSANGNNILIKLARNTGENTSSKTLGLLSQDLAPNGQGYITTEGQLEGVDTSAAGSAGDPVWLGPTGNLIFGTGNKPYGINHLVYLGVVERKQSNNGKIYVKVQNGFELEELHNVDINHRYPLINDDVLRYDSNSGVWYNRPINTGTFQTQIDSLSGTLTSDYLTISSASSTYATITNLGITGSTLATNLASTGSTLQTNINTLTTNLATTGSTLNTKINNLSGYINSQNSNIVFTTGDQSISGIKTFNNDVVFTGTAIFNEIDLSDTDNILLSGVNIQIVSGSITLTNMPTISGNPLITGVDLSSYLTSSTASATYATITNLAGTGSTLATNLASTGSTLSTNLENTGSTLQTNINNLSGYINSSSSNIVFTTGNQTISGIKTFAEDTTFGDPGQGDFLVISGNSFTVYGSGNFTSGLFVNGTPVLLSGQATQVDLGSTVRTTGNQTVSGVKNFQSAPLVSGKEVYFQKDIVYFTGNNFTPDSSIARTFEYVLTGLAGASATLNAPINMFNGENIVIKIKQSPSGSNNMIFNAAYKFPGGVSPSLTLTPSKADIYTVLKIDSNFYSTYVKDFIN